MDSTDSWGVLAVLIRKPPGHLRDGDLMTPFADFLKPSVRVSNFRSKGF